MTPAEAIEFLANGCEEPQGWLGWEDHRRAVALLSEVALRDQQLEALVKTWTDQVERLRSHGGREHVAHAIAACAEEVQALVLARNSKP